MSLAPALARAICGVVLVVACGTNGDKQSFAGDKSAAPPAASAAGSGTVESVEVTATGTGPSRGDAIQDAAIRAIEQVQGRAIAISTVSDGVASLAIKSDNSSAGSHATSNVDASATIGGRQLSDATHGVITSLTVERESQQAGRWNVTVRAAIAKYSPFGGDKTHVVVAAPQVEGDQATPALRTEVRDGIAEALTATGHVAVLDRSDSEVNAELAFAASGEARSTEQLKLSQADVADFVVLTTITDLRVDRHARRMRTADREIVSYEGHAVMSFRVVHLASRQVVASGTFEASKVADESLADTVDPSVWKTAMLRELEIKVSHQAVNAFVPGVR
jgi:hypothetical protein